MKSGFVAVVGKPNAGKSTLINALIGQKISIVSEKPQTTRFKLRGILTRPEGQIVLVDTPGFHQPKDALGRYLNSQVSGTMKEVDLILFLVDASAELSDEDRSLVEEIKESKLPCVVVLTKKDISSNEKIDEIKKNIAALLTPVDWVVLSALKREGLNELIEKIIALIPEGERLYPEEMIIDYPLTIQAAEIIREKVLMHTYQEIPHSVAVKIIKIIERSEKNLLEIYGEIYVEKDSQKKIIIGKAGSLIKKIGTQARQELEFITGRKIFLDLQVKVKEKWRDKESFIKAIYQSG